ncbi:MAG TPA: prolipoprotein diacylglyceryl transferase [Candidatus Dormibacteraeota bacterium]|nr:prolipoprotein diacylglyceryl transferase [Candidatus Dormibacteraeota bacterium]
MVTPALHAALGTITIDIDPVIHIGSLSVHWYGIMYAIAFLVAFRFGVVPYVEPRGVSRQTAERALVWTIIFGLLGGRLYYVIQQPNLGDYLHDPIRIIAVWEGGMAFFGAIIAGLATVTVLARRYRVSSWLLWDAAVIFAVVGQPIGRIGNVINGDILGTRSDLPWATAYTNPHAVLQSCCQLGVAYQPAAVYEALGTIVIGLILFALLRRHVRVGALAVAYVPLYAISQLILFQFRSSEPVLALGLHQAQWTALAILLVVSPIVYAVWRRTSAAPAVERAGESRPAPDAAPEPQLEPAAALDTELEPAAASEPHIAPTPAPTTAPRRRKPKSAAGRRPRPRTRP